MGAKSIAVLTSGGDAPGMNAAVRAVVRTGINFGMKVYGVMRGYNGLLGGDLKEMNMRSVSDIMQHGGTALFTARSPEFNTPEGVKKAADVCRKMGIDGVVVIGGDGSFRGCKDMAAQGIPCVGLPGTIDNDMGYTDYTIGFDTACNTVLDAMLKLRDTITSHDRIMILEVMGRHCGDIALKTALAGGAEYVILPEAPTDVDAIAASVKKGFDKGKTSTIIVLAEGRNDLKDELKEKVSAATGRTVNHVALSYIQRGGIPSMFDRVLASRLAARAVELIECGQSGRVVGVHGSDIIDMNVIEALKCKKSFDEHLFMLATTISK